MVASYGLVEYWQSLWFFGWEKIEVERESPGKKFLVSSGHIFKSNVFLNLALSGLKHMILEGDGQVLMLLLLLLLLTLRQKEIVVVIEGEGKPI